MVLFVAITVVEGKHMYDTLFLYIALSICWMTRTLLVFGMQLCRVSLGNTEEQAALDRQGV